MDVADVAQKSGRGLCQEAAEGAAHKSLPTSAPNRRIHRRVPGTIGSVSDLAQSAHRKLLAAQHAEAGRHVFSKEVPRLNDAAAPIAGF